MTDSTGIFQWCQTKGRRRGDTWTDIDGATDFAGALLVLTTNGAAPMTVRRISVSGVVTHIWRLDPARWRSLSGEIED